MNLKMLAAIVLINILVLGVYSEPVEERVGEFYITALDVISGKVGDESLDKDLVKKSHHDCAEEHLGTTDSGLYKILEKNLLGGKIKNLNMATLTIGAKIMKEKKVKEMTPYTNCMLEKTGVLKEGE